MDDGVTETLQRLAKSGPLPKLVAVDLDYTCWPLWVDTHVDPPLKRRGEAINEVVDRFGQKLSFYKHVPAILLFLRERNVKIAAASRTSAPDTARQALKNLFIRSGSPPSQETISSIRLFDILEIYPGSKVQHFRQIHSKTGVDYHSMVFFDDESRNAEVQSKLGVHFHLVGHGGLDIQAFERAILDWRRSRVGSVNGTM